MYALGLMTKTEYRLHLIVRLRQYD
jgi:hypothetical protein